MSVGSEARAQECLFILQLPGPLLLHGEQPFLSEALRQVYLRLRLLRREHRADIIDASAPVVGLRARHVVKARLGCPHADFERQSFLPATFTARRRRETAQPASRKARRGRRGRLWASEGRSAPAGARPELGKGGEQQEAEKDTPNAGLRSAPCTTRKALSTGSRCWLLPWQRACHIRAPSASGDALEGKLKIILEGSVS